MGIRYNKSYLLYRRIAGPVWPSFQPFPRFDGNCEISESGPNCPTRENFFKNFGVFGIMPYPKNLSSPNEVYMCIREQKIMTERSTAPYIVRYLKPEEKINRFLLLQRKGEPYITPEPGIVYIQCEGEQLKYAWFRCPCNGTGDDDCNKNAVKLNLDPAIKQQDPDASIWSFLQMGEYADFSPSVWRDARRGCHFFLKASGVQWC